MCCLTLGVYPYNMNGSSFVGIQNEVTVVVSFHH